MPASMRYQSVRTVPDPVKPVHCLLEVFERCLEAITRNCAAIDFFRGTLRQSD